MRHLTLLIACALLPASSAFAQSDSDACQPAREMLCEICGSGSLLCQDCDDPDRLFCEATPRPGHPEMDCTEAIARITELTEDLSATREAFCEHAEQSLLMGYEVPRACAAVRVQVCAQCGLLTCAFGRSASSIAELFGSDCERLLLAAQDPELFGLRPGQICELASPLR